MVKTSSYSKYGSDIDNTNRQSQ